MKAIETRYKGYRFRSRLEARWAVFFDAMGLMWEYEPEGFKLTDGRCYLPDFKVTSSQGYITWYEVKSKLSSDDGKLNQLSKDFFSKHEDGFLFTDSFTLLCGDPKDVLGEEACLKCCPRCGNIMTYDEGSKPKIGDACYPCSPCDIGTPGGCSDPETGFNGLIVTPNKGSIDINSSDLYQHSMLIFHASNKARSARFEHGEHS